MKQLSLLTTFFFITSSFAVEESFVEQLLESDYATIQEALQETNTSLSKQKQTLKKFKTFATEVAVERYRLNNGQKSPRESAQEDSLAKKLMQKGIPLNLSIQNFLDAKLESLDREDTDVSISKMSLTSLKGLEKWKNLIKRLNLSDNSLPSFSFYTLPSNFKQITELDLSHNQITEMPNISALGNLEKLNISYNAVSVVPADTFSGSEQLKSLDLSHNQITKIKLNTLQALFANAPFKELNVSHNQLTDANFLEETQNKTLLERLDISSNPIKRVPNELATQFPELTALNIADCQIQQFSPRMIQKLMRLNNYNITGNTKIILPKDNSKEFWDIMKMLGCLGTAIGSGGNPLIAWPALGKCYWTFFEGAHAKDIRKKGVPTTKGYYNAK